jgi:hypothetical protein
MFFLCVWYVGLNSGALSLGPCPEAFASFSLCFSYGLRLTLPRMTLNHNLPTSASIVAGPQVCTTTTGLCIHAFQKELLWLLQVFKYLVSDTSSGKLKHWTEWVNWNETMWPKLREAIGTNYWKSNLRNTHLFSWL